MAKADRLAADRLWKKCRREEEVTKEHAAQLQSYHSYYFLLRTCKTLRFLVKQIYATTESGNSVALTQSCCVGCKREKY